MAFTTVMIGWDCFNGHTYGTTQFIKVGWNYHDTPGSIVGPSSSIIIPVGYRVTMYDARNGTGNSVVLTNASANLGCFGNVRQGGLRNSNWNDNVRSMLVELTLPGWYTAINYLGNVFVLNVGLLVYGRAGVGLDLRTYLQSLSIPSGYAVQFCDGSDYNSSVVTKTYTSSQPSLSGMMSSYNSLYVFSTAAQAPADKVRPVITATATIVSATAEIAQSPAAKSPAVQSPAVQAIAVSDPPVVVPVDPRIHVSVNPPTANKMYKQDLFPHSWIGTSITLPNDNNIMFSYSDCENACLNNSSCAYSVFNSSTNVCSLLQYTATLSRTKQANTTMSLKTIS